LESISGMNGLDPHFRVARPVSALVVSLFALLAFSAPDASRAQAVRLSTNNDTFSGGRGGRGGGAPRDDLYTFAVQIDVESRGRRVSLRENAFTDRAAGTRFDETVVSLGRDVVWTLAGREIHASVEAGVARIGKGIFGESAQNAVHRAIGSDRVDLPYQPAHVYPQFSVATERLFEPVEGVQVGPHVEAEWILGLRSHAVLGVQGRWSHAGTRLEVDGFVGSRFTSAEFAPLEPHLAGTAAIARLTVSVRERLFVAWSYNDFGDERPHLHLGYRFAPEARVF
jgi:hypothetical protein